MNKKTNWKLPLIIGAGVIAVILLCVFGVQSSQNRAFALEEQVNTAQSDIKVQEKRRIEYADEGMTQEDIKKYQMEHLVNYSMTLSLDTKCPVGYDYLKCSSKEYGMSCRTCVNYNPLRMLYEKELKPGVMLKVPLQVLLDDAKIQLDHK